MEVLDQREIVVEVEHVRLVRRRARVRPGYCGECGRPADFLPLTGAARLFDMREAEVMQFATANRCHIRPAADGELLICLTVLLTVIKARTGNSGMRVIGDKNNE